MEIANTTNLPPRALAEPGWPLSASRMPAAPLRTRLATSVALRRALPTSLVVRRTEARAAARWEAATAERKQALAVMETIVSGTPRAAEVDALAREHMIEQDVHNALFWQPWRMPSMTAESAKHTETALSSGRGVVVSACHLGPIFLNFWPLTTLRTGYAVAGPWFFEQPTTGYWGRRLARWHKGLQRRNERLLSSVNVYATLRSLLEAGELTLIYFDMPGSRRTQFLGKPVMLATGSARLAIETGALILPLRGRREGHRTWTDVLAPLDPRELGGYEQLQDALAATHERWILQRPSALEDPNRIGAWEGCASAREWIRPRPAQPRS